MAADLIMPTLPDQQVQSQYFATAALPAGRPSFGHARSQSYHQQPSSNSNNFNNAYYSQQPSPLSSGHGSPTSPGTMGAGGRTHGARQNRPLFMPAVLRPTEFPSKLPQSPQSEDGPDSAIGNFSLRRTSNSLISLPGLNNVFGSRLTRRTTGDSGKGFVDAELDPELFPEVLGEPSRDHWKPDPESTVCDDPTCARAFNYFYRRHHCRKCGNIFCDPHSAHAIPLDQDCNYNPRGSLARSCGHCFAEFIAWKSQNNSRAGSDNGSTVDAPTSGRPPNTGVPASVPASPITAGSPSGSANLGQARGPAEVAASVPRDWNWSTF